MRRKSIEQMKAELIVAELLKELTPKELLDYVRGLARDYAIDVGQRIAIAVLLALMWDRWEDFDKTAINEMWEDYNKYFENYMHGEEHAYQSILAVNDLLDGNLLHKPILENILSLAEEEKLKEQTEVEKNAGA